MTNDLKPCPFCGGEARFARGFDYGEIGCIRWVYCSKCGVMTRSDFHVTEADAAKAWNKRVEPLNYIECYECQNGAPMVPFRTCKDVNELEFGFKCSVCGDWEDINYPRYCPHCGARVMYNEND